MKYLALIFALVFPAFAQSVTASPQWLNIAQIGAQPQFGINITNSSTTPVQVTSCEEDLHAIRGPNPCSSAEHSNESIAANGKITVSFHDAYRWSSEEINEVLSGQLALFIRSRIRVKGQSPTDYCWQYQPSTKDFAPCK